MVDCSGLEGDMHMIKSIEFGDQNSIGKSSRSNPVTYIGAFADENDGWMSGWTEFDPQNKAY